MSNFIIARLRFVPKGVFFFLFFCFFGGGGGGGEWVGEDTDQDP